MGSYWSVFGELHYGYGTCWSLDISACGIEVVIGRSYWYGLHSGVLRGHCLTWRLGDLELGSVDICIIEISCCFLFITEFKEV